MKNKTLLKQVPVLTMAVAASMFVASCTTGGTEETFADKEYGDHAADIKKIFGDDVKDGSQKKYTATKVSTDQKGEEDLSGWKNKYKMTFTTAKEKRKVGDKDVPVLNFGATLPKEQGIQPGHKEIAPESGTLALGDKSGSEVSVTRFKGNAVDDKFKDGKLTVKDNGDLVLKYRVEKITGAARSEGSLKGTWTVELKAD